MVSVVMITYNHEKYIRDAVESVLMQKCNFDVELIIADDSSPDSTEGIIKDIIDKHPKGRWIKYTKHAQNKGMMPNFIWALQKCKGKYVALCEGDDYWIDENKLQMQYDFLENHNEYDLIGSRYFIRNDNLKDNIRVNTEFLKKNEIELIDFLYKREFHTSTIFFRKFEKLPEWFESAYPGDKFLVAICSNNKPIKIFNNIFSVYRINEVGVTSNITKKIVTDRTEIFVNCLIKTKSIISPNSYEKLEILIKYNKILVDFGRSTGFDKITIFLKHLIFLIINRKIFYWKVPISRLR